MIGELELCSYSHLAGLKLVMMIVINDEFSLDFHPHLLFFIEHLARIYSNRFKCMGWICIIVHYPSEGFLEKKSIN